jgi:putative ABC transport system permease protein
MVSHLIKFSLKRLRTHRWLALSQVLGLMAAVALVVAVPMYADAINYDILSSSLTESSSQTRRQPFDFVFRYIGSWYGAISPQQYEPLDQYLSQQASRQVGLPSQQLTRYAATANLQLYPGAQVLSPQARLDLVKVAFLDGVFGQVQLVEGNLPRSLEESGNVIEALVSLDLANELGLQVGQDYALFNPATASNAAFRQDVRISGLWVAGDPKNELWALYPAESFRKKLLILEEGFWSLVDGLPSGLDEATWRLTLDGNQVNSSQVSRLLTRIDVLENRVNAMLPNTDLETSPAPAMRQYQQSVRSLSGSLFAFSIPVLGLVLFFLALISNLFVRSQRNEIAVLRSRGASRLWIVGIYAIEWALLGLVSLIPGILLGNFLAGLMSKTSSFLEFSRPTATFLQINSRDAGIGLLALVVGIGFCLLPVWKYGRDTIISYKLERARQKQTPFWMRYYLDLACLLPSLYGLYTLQVRGRLAILGKNLGSNDPYQNPLLFLLPALMILGLSLLVLRILPFLFNLLASLSARLRGVALLYVLRHYARSGNAYQSVLLLILITFGLAAFTSSMAFSLDRTVEDSIRYTNGAALNLVEGGEFISTESNEQAAESNSSSSSGSEGYWNFLPVSDHLSLPGVLSATRVGIYEAGFQSGNRSANGNLMGIDRASFGQTAFFRSDFATEPLNGLLNRLASTPDAILVDQTTWERFNLEVGSTLDVRVTINQTVFPTSFIVAGVFTRFPTWASESQKALFVANLDYLFETWGMLQPYEVWLNTSPTANTQEIVRGINNLGVSVVRVRDTRADIDQALITPARQGVLGMLSIGFLASSALTVIGFCLFAVFSYRERFIQMGVLRAIGLSISQMRNSLGLELAGLIILGVASGSGIGMFIATLFIPYLPVSTGTGVEILPQITQIAWSKMVLVYLLFSCVLLLGLAMLVFFLRKIKIFQAIKLGETL